MYRTYFSYLDHVLRGYIENVFHIGAPACTTPEFLKKAASSSLLDNDKRLILAHFLENADRVKFALHQPSQAECAEALETARQFIKKNEVVTQPKSD